MTSRIGAVLCAVVLMGAAACSGDDDRPQVDGTIVQPGKPGEDSKTLDEAPEVEPADANDADIAFAQMMVPHHAQALEMAAFAPAAGGGEGVRTFAERIAAAQKPEIVLMASWLTKRGQDAPTAEQIEKGELGPLSMDAHDHHGSGAHESMEDMPGMASEADLERLSQAKGEAFDELFLELMIMHHQGAMEMVDEVLAEGSDQELNELAAGIGADQSAETDRMRQMLEAM
ncbi:DUF305 domain-containing protein [Aeromicrobium sp. IC_218]|uniref:DUF305 domain-containing protein n=1 Tax=Aeromicrobium sp. IC_218 TaxID=2545468 RepID=UPI001A9558FF|nr:DUF305 domain-containing protein [Aeromicrobium sp. IC_218]